MPEPLSELDLETAWKRVQFDLGHRTFVPYAFEEQIVNHKKEDWLAQLRERLSHPYIPNTCEIIEVPKEGFHIRPGSRLSLEDHVVYLAILQELYPRISEFLRSTDAQKDYAYTLRPPADVPWFTQPPTNSWMAFKRVSIERIEGGASHVLISDLAGFYENIDLGKLRLTLEALGLPNPLLIELSKLLNAWAGTRRRGIPQGVSGSDLLAKVYLESVDRHLERAGFEHVRYSDDIRIFTRSELEARQALVRLTSLMRDAGLNLQTKKTRILTAAEARQEIEGRVPDIERVRDDLFEAVRREGFSNPYLSFDDLPELVETQAEVAVNVLEDAFRADFLDNEGQFDSWLFHYILPRLGTMTSRVGVDFAFASLLSHPEETSIILTYLRAFRDDEGITGRVIDFCESAEAIYPYQLYQIMRWLYDQRINSDRSLRFARAVVSNHDNQLWLRSYALALLGSIGDSTDLENIENEYGRAGPEIEKAIVLCSLRRMAAGRRNAIYARFGPASFLTNAAVDWARTDH